jgi:hypothetical protein
MVARHSRIGDGRTNGQSLRARPRTPPRRRPENRLDYAIVTGEPPEARRRAGLVVERDMPCLLS